MNEFNAIVYDINRKKFVSYDIMPYLRDSYQNLKKIDRPKTYDEIKKFVDSELMYQFWSRCEYEIIVSDWPPSGVEEKIDVYWQCKMNLDLITRLLIEDLGIKN